MLSKLIGRFTNNNENKLSNIKSIVSEINELESKYKKFSDEEIKAQTIKWQKHLRSENFSSDEVSKYLDAILPDAYAMVREIAVRKMSQRHRDVQILSGIILHQGKIAEQKTGEGKTLTATLPLYLNSLTGNGVHLVTPNDYLSKHGVGWYGPIFEALGINAGVIVHDSAFVYDPSYDSQDSIDTYSRHLKPCSRSEAYKCDITYGTNHEFGFDYLRDNMAVSKEQISQTNPNENYGKHFFAIVDEVDFVLIDVARTPLIISQQKDLRPDRYYQFATLSNELVPNTDYDIDEKYKTVTMTELGINKIERKLGVKNLYENDFETVHHIENALRAKELHVKDKDYVVKDGRIIIVDQNTGRLLDGNRWSDGLHQAVEAKEGLEIQPESKTVATISYQNYYRLYEKLAGMTGTAMTESEEFFKMYSLDVVSIPTNKPIKRLDQSDVIYKTQSAKFRAVANDIAQRNKLGQPILVGTTSVEKSQLLSGFLKRLKIPHEILNAKNNDKEAGIIAQAGKKGSVTVSTNMAGRGVDIILGGDPYSETNYNNVVSSGGLYVIGTERHDSRRIDNQLRGRAGRQGDVGESRFYMSLQDDLLRIFGGETIESFMNKMGVDENLPIEARLISKSIENAQKKVEGMNFDQRRSIVDYDDVMNVQRESIYSMRRRILLSTPGEKFFDFILDKLSTYVDDDFAKVWVSKNQKYGDELWHEVVKRVSLEVIDVLWMDHIDLMDDLRSGVRLRGYGQVDPLVEYKREGRQKYEELMIQIWSTISDRLLKVEVQVEKRQEVRESPIDKGNIDYKQGNFESGVANEVQGLISDDSANKKDKPGRNDLCYCGSGKKYKKCHGK
ncbi:preprotein translocase subunit SecA [candidate division WWE3 bacterium CG_4_9_14_0_2_um_filter_35_11]|uniref:Protein translocase subunit SecA n=1 Tax=candidate division WWE3 bacterium CG_4_9_14_0_2_um_filter_35_11 TaxID=1975077 RepID=A0A2M8ELN9_UNCKA|nr:MAG: preprotein translocase subunit SecA [candidate division WWE3 bacterium CG10_big_fil_rev_8_21_14_0_10_35_32]PJC23652.1 MAG: preprotein translocase subunit SecA [candidate division WWE3 bacterium CG_4_9_14_0_2_um_filter_35_11]